MKLAFYKINFLEQHIFYHFFQILQNIVDKIFLIFNFLHNIYYLFYQVLNKN